MQMGEGGGNLLALFPPFSNAALSHFLSRRIS